MSSRRTFNGLVIVILVLLTGSLRMTRATESLKALRTSEAVAGLVLHQPLDPIAGPGTYFSEFRPPNDGRSGIELTISDAPPTLQSINPARNAHTAPLTTTISVIYDQAIDAGTVTSRTFVVHGMQSGLVSSTHGVVKGNTIVVTPTNGFHQGELVYAVATTRTLNVTGTGPLSGTLWQFNAGEVRDRCVEGFTEVYTGSLTGVKRSSVAWGDYDNDGDLDILLTGDKGSWTPTAKIYQNTGSGFSEVYTGSLTGVLYGSVAWGDYDNDGDLDILLTGQGSDHQTNAKVYQNTGSDFITDTVASANLWGQYLSSVAWGDYDNDGDLDILLTGGAKHITRLYQTTGSGFSAVYTESLTGVNRSSVAWGDYDNDGDLDILLTGEDSGGNRVSKIYQNTGGGFSEVYAGSLTGVREGSVAWGDYDGDGDLDILLTGEDSDWSSIAKIYQNTGSGFSEVYAGSLTSVRRYSSVAWGDYDNDGDLDILLTGYSDGDRVSRIYRNDECPIDLVLAKSAATQSAAPGEPITYTLTFYNAGIVTATGVIITDIVPISVTVGSVVSSGVAITDTGASPLYVWDMQDLAPGEGGVITITGVLSTGLPGGHTFTNTAAITTTALDGDPGNNDDRASVTVAVIAQADLRIAKSIRPTVPIPDSSLTYTLRITNAGSSAAHDVMVTDLLPDGLSGVGAPEGAGWSCDPSDGGFTCTLPSLGVGAAPTIVITASAPQSSATLTNTAVVSSAVEDPATGNNTVALTTAIDLPPIADAGADQTAFVSTTVTLSGTDSLDPDDHSLAYGWAQVGGSTVSLSDAAAISPTFTTPDTPSVLTFTLTVTDAYGLASRPDTVVVTVTDRVIAGLSAESSAPTTLGQPTFFTATVAAGSNIACQWSFGDGITATGNPVNHIYVTTGTHTAVVTASNSVNSMTATTQAVIAASLNYRVYLPLVMRSE